MEKIVTEEWPKWPVITEEDVKAAAEVMRRGEMSLAGGGGELQKFEEEFAEYQGRKFCLSVNGGTAALDTGVALSGAGPGDEVLVSPHTWGATVGCILHNNAIPVFVDIDPKTFTMEPKKIEEKITERTKAIMVVHIYGIPADMDPIMEIAKKHKLMVIEDCAQATGSKYKGRLVGSLGHIGCFSLQASKNLACGEGGAIVLDDEELYEEALLYASHPTRHGRAVSGRMARYVDSLGWNFRMFPPAAAVARVQLKHLDERNEIKRKNIERLFEGIRALPGIGLPELPDYLEPSYHMIPLTYKDEDLGGVDREEFLSQMREAGVRIGHYVTRPIYLRPRHQEYSFYTRGCPWTCPYADRLVEYKKGDCPVTEEICEKRELTLSASPLAQPCDKLIDQIIAAFKAVCGRFAKKAKVSSR